MYRLSATLFMGLFVMACGNEGYERFKPVYRSGDRLVVSELPLTPELRANVKRVLAFYDVPFKEDSNGELLISKKDWEDLEMMWNYTTKAHDPAWLKAHRGMGDGPDKRK
jgi:hypothetical protein